MLQNCKSTECTRSRIYGTEHLSLRSGLNGTAQHCKECYGLVVVMMDVQGDYRGSDQAQFNHNDRIALEESG